MKYEMSYISGPIDNIARNLLWRKILCCNGDDNTEFESCASGCTEEVTINKIYSNE